MCALVMADVELDQVHVFMEVDLEQQGSGNNCNSNDTLSKLQVPLLAAMVYSTVEPQSEPGEVPKEGSPGERLAQVAFCTGSSLVPITVAGKLLASSSHVVVCRLNNKNNSLN